jgi:hypothetical protein
MKPATSRVLHVVCFLSVHSLTYSLSAAKPVINLTIASYVNGDLDLYCENE